MNATEVWTCPNAMIEIRLVIKSICVRVSTANLMMCALVVHIIGYRPIWIFSLLMLNPPLARLARVHIFIDSRTLMSVPSLQRWNVTAPFLTHASMSFGVLKLGAGPEL
jgi:hypothetical protein